MCINVYTVCASMLWIMVLRIQNVINTCTDMPRMTTESAMDDQEMSKQSAATIATNEYDPRLFLRAHSLSLLRYFYRHPIRILHHRPATQLRHGHPPLRICNNLFENPHQVFPRIAPADSWIHIKPNDRYMQ